MEAGVQPRLIARWQESHAAGQNHPQGKDSEGAFASPQQRAFFGLCSSYRDILFPLRPYPTR